jgi:ABC-type glycerol-3-phosphate transport system substrate-binding protein
MLKKFVGFLMVTIILASLLSACGSSTTSADAKKLLSDLTAKGRLTVNQPGWVHVIENIVYDTDSKDRGNYQADKRSPLFKKSTSGITLTKTNAFTNMYGR